MPITTVYDFLSPSGFTYDPTRIEFSGSLAQLKQTLGLYPTDNPSIKTNVAINTDGVLSFSSVNSFSGSDSVKFTLEVEGVEKYWNGTSWVNSSGYVQSNTASDINDHCTSLLISLGANVKLVVYLHSDDGTTSPTITSETITYSFHSPSPDVLDRCTVWGYIYNDSGLPLEGVKVTVRLLNSVKYKTKTLVGNVPVFVYTDSNGYWEIDLVEGANMLPQTKYQFKFQRVDYELTESKLVPNQVSANYYDLPT
jgi:hypothetical protein